MRILLIAHTRESDTGWGRYTNDLARALEGAGHTVTVLSDWLRENKRRPLSPPDAYLGYSLGWLLDAVLVRDALTALRSDIVHVTVEPYLSAVPLSRMAGRKLYLTVHGTYAYYPLRAPRLVRPVTAWVYARALKSVHTVIAVSQNTERAYRADLGGAHIAPPRIEVVHNGVWMSDHKNTAEKAERFTIVSLGAVNPRKGILEALHGVAELKRAYGITAEYRIIGATDREGYTQKLITSATESKILDQLVLLGRLSGAEVEHELARAHALVLLPRTFGSMREGFGLVYLEANAYGVPALGARGTVSEEAIEEGKSGLLVDADNPADIAKALSAIRDGFIHADSARAWARAHDWSLIVEQYAHIYGHP